MASSAGIGPATPGGGGASASASRSIACACRSDGVKRASQAFLYGVNTLNGRPACESTSSHSKITLVLRGPERDAASRERLRDRGVARQRSRLVVAIGVDSARAERGGELGDRVPGERVPDDQSAAARAERSVELAHAVPDELHAPVVRRRQRVEDLAIEDEGAEDRARFPQCAGTAPRDRNRAGRGGTRPARDRACARSRARPRRAGSAGRSRAPRGATAAHPRRRSFPGTSAGRRPGR